MQKYGSYHIHPYKYFCELFVLSFVSMIVQVLKLLREAYDRVKALLKKVCPRDLFYVSGLLAQEPRFSFGYVGLLLSTYKILVSVQ